MSSECHRILVEMKRQELVMERDALLSQIAQRRCYFPLHSGSGAVRRNFSVEANDTVLMSKQLRYCARAYVKTDYMHEWQ